MSTLQEILAALGGFISTILIPFLFGIAFLFFLINIFRYFILESTNEQSREKAKRSALYGLAAFVFLLILWGLVGILVRGIGIDDDRSLCSDYISFFQGDCGQPGRDFASSGTISSGNQLNPGGGQSSGGGGGVITDNDNQNSSGGNDSTPPPQFSGLAELVFGTGKDAASFTDNQLPPQAEATTPTVSPTASCEAGIQTLQQASRVENTQAAYLYAPGDTSAWTNITDAHSANSVVYDADTIASKQTNTDHYLVHTHPQGRLGQLGLAPTGHGPTSADIAALCSNLASPAQHIVVDWSGAWLIQSTGTSCPLNTVTQEGLAITETIIATAGLESASRIKEIEAYLQDDLPPDGAKLYISELLTADKSLFSNSTTAELVELANSLLVESDLSIEYYTSAAGLCGAL